MRRTLLFSLVAAALCVSIVAATPFKKPTSVVIRGQVTDSNGEGVGDVSVRVLATRRVVKFLSVQSRPAEAELAMTRTDANGFYEMSVAKNRDYDFYFLRFYGADGFDTVKFSTPEDREITALVNKRRPVVLDQTLQFAPGWDSVRRLVDLYGGDSMRGRIVRDLGVPERTQRSVTTEGVERETWWYDSVGVAYVIENGQVMDKKTFQPQQESVPIASR